MTLALEMFAIAPAHGKANLSASQSQLLTGKALWIFTAAEAGCPVVSTIALTRAAWEGLQAERQSKDDRLRKHWVATLFKLVSPNSAPPRLVVRTSAPRHSSGLMAAVDDLIAPSHATESVDPQKPLARAITAAFASFIPDQKMAKPDQDADARDIVIVQAEAGGQLVRFATRDPQTGKLGPASVNGKPLNPALAGAATLTKVLDTTAGQAMSCLVSLDGDGVRLVSARPFPVSAAAELEAAVDRVARASWSRAQAVASINPARLTQMLHPRLKTGDTNRPIASGLGVSPGAASGLIVFTSEDAARARARGRHCILVVTETGPTDIEGMRAATGILTTRGGMTSHAAVIARITGKPCVAGVRTLQIDLTEMSCEIDGQTFYSGDRLTIDGTEGAVYAGALPLSQPHLGGAMGKLLGWSDVERTIAVRTNAETVESARTALNFGAEGIGLARSEHMFFSPERMVALRRLILSEDETARTSALTGLVDFQTGDYADLFQTMAGRPVTVRLFDPPLHEFLPRTEEDIEETAASLGLPVKALRRRLERLAEINPMLGHRGCRLAITYPEILEMQIQALIGGVTAASAHQAEPVTLEIMVPFVSTASEVIWIRERVMAMLDAGDLPAEARARVAFGTMIELPRAALRAGDIAKGVDFFSFGTNDLTQTTFGISRDDAPAFLAAYQRKRLYDSDPFVHLDERGVGELIAMAIERGKAANPKLKIGICGEHAGDPTSLQFLSRLDIDYVSCSPYRVPVARLALAQAAHADA